MKNLYSKTNAQDHIPTLKDVAIEVLKNIAPSASLGEIMYKIDLAELETFPMAGRLVPEFEGTSINLREVIYQGYRIIYRLTPGSGC